MCRAHIQIQKSRMLYYETTNVSLNDHQFGKEPY